MAYIFGWLVFSVGVGAIAQARGRNLFLWALLAGLISPIIAVIVLLVMDDESDGDKAGEESTDQRGIGVEEFASRIEKFRDLYVEEVLTEDEFSIKKSELINDLGRGGINEREEEFLNEVKDLRDKDIIDKSDVDKLKSLVL
jgi:hypothetical protein